MLALMHRRRIAFYILKATKRQKQLQIQFKNKRNIKNQNTLIIRRRFKQQYLQRKLLNSHFLNLDIKIEFVQFNYQKSNKLIQQKNNSYHSKLIEFSLTQIQNLKVNQQWKKQIIRRKSISNTKFK
ncbi:hypothetical protein TTHERM_000741693 (macronuclear) [Tetrahymena thermophila SB210]|uniref:Uncharacterized protein n=1 Tax=Tetrahymena thermophila (strain SB210) TaxID=312017 RepID=W7XEF1_TETTS|nr:hypothetical protein TTHERM_000741693 [Tetrahymena thermophila SB210]EWS75003.1 hypothetical protein TTHERM_000741693 [Tetrahymena thermophila SB210]|eukprot:XP_012652461.1 hypothetical protein TTHERM_000741693 [Tetrahymena thermophila SB210]